MLTRRHFLTRISAFAGGCLVAAHGHTASSENFDHFFMPDESAPHKRTWMAFGASEYIWGARLLPEVRRNLATIANTIAQYEPVTMLVRPNEMKVAQSMLDAAIELVPFPLDDLWIRDSGPTFVISATGDKAAIDFNFNGWGEKQSYTQDAKVAAFVAQLARVPVLETELVLEGGCIEVDGQGTAIISKSCSLNDNRNPDISQALFEDLLMPLLGLDKIIWLPGIKGMDITDGHTDFYARFAAPSVVVAGFDPDPQSYEHSVTQRHLEILANATDAQGRQLDTVVLPGPEYFPAGYAAADFSAGYLGYYLCNGAVLMQSFGDKQADQAAKEILQDVFPERKIEQLLVNGIAAGGGSIHCATQQEPAI